MLTHTVQTPEAVHSRVKDSSLLVDNKPGDGSWILVIDKKIIMPFLLGCPADELHFSFN